MSDTTSVNLRIDKDLKQQAETLFASLGINMTTAINMFLRQSVRDQGIPFRVTAAKDYDSVPAYVGKSAKYENYDEFVAASLKESDMKVAEGRAKYYTADEVRAKLEDLFNEKV